MRGELSSEQEIDIGFTPITPENRWDVIHGQQAEFYQRLSDPERTTMADLLLVLERAKGQIKSITGISAAQIQELKKVRKQNNTTWMNHRLSLITDKQALVAVQEEIKKRLNNEK